MSVWTNLGFVACGVDDMYNAPSAFDIVVGRIMSTGSSLSYRDDAIILPFSFDLAASNFKCNGGVSERLSVHRSMSTTVSDGR